MVDIDHREREKFSHPWPSSRGGSLEQALNAELEFREITMFRVDFDLPADLLGESPETIAEKYRLPIEKVEEAQRIIKTWDEDPDTFEYIWRKKKAESDRPVLRGSTRTVMIDGQEVILSGDNSRQ